MSDVMMGVLPEGETAPRKAFWITLESAGYPVMYGYECSRCESVAQEAVSVCPCCGAEMSNMVIRSMWVDFKE